MTLDFHLMKEISHKTPSKIVLLVLDGMGGLPDTSTGKTELETADTPNLDRLARNGVCGLTIPVSRGVTPGSAPGHLALFGYDPVSCIIGRGVLEAIGIGFDLQETDIAARGNFCTVNQEGIVTDRRAGRISTEKCTELSARLDGMNIDGVDIIVKPVKEHRFIAVFRGKDLHPDIDDTDPQHTGARPLPVNARNRESEKIAGIVNRFIERTGEVLSAEHPANMVLLRGFSSHPALPQLQDALKLTPAAIAAYPMYRGLASLAGMKLLDAGTTIGEEFNALEEHYGEYDFFFLHLKATDSSGEDGDFARKVRVFEEIDGYIPRLTALKPEVIVVTGDHSTPSRLASHSWHPVPTLLHSEWCRPDRVERFSEAECLAGGLGQFPAQDIMPLAMANALKLDKFGA